MPDTDLHACELLEIGRRIAAREVSSVEATQAQLDRIRRLDGELKSYACVMAEGALAAARAADAELDSGRHRGPLHGVPFAVKDLCWTTDAPTAAGMTIHRDYRPTDDATVVKRLRAAGAVILGKLQLTEGAYADHHPAITPPRNPWGAQFWSGASSSGSGVATAAGLCYGSLGSDTGGSIRFPSAANGVTGLKPTWGRVSRYGVFELAATLDHIGPMARSAADCGAILGVIAGADPDDPTAVPLPVPDFAAALAGGVKGLRLGVDADWIARDVDPVARAVTQAGIDVLAGLGAEIVPVRFPDPTAVITDWFPLCGIETAVAHEATYPSRQGEYGPALSGLIELGRAQSGLDVQKIILRREDFRGRVRALFEDIDLLAVPAQAFAGPTLATMATLGEDAALMNGLLRFTCPFDMTGSPTITLPGGFTEAGAPVGFQLVGPHFGEAALVRAGHAFQGATDWHRRHPPGLD
ncbi:amidase [uncultured Methylobacterium sp.]|uniref:amidase n=1 Tax=uncultured Methylobacterium sp. TaxID=157278 RepID=UPI00260C63F9|nr:amidase [uncultured Methylobacterium sp.]